MNGFASLAVLACAFASASAIYDPASGVFTLGALSLNGGNALALTSGSTSVFLTSAGLVAGGLALLGVAVVKAAILANLVEGRSKRSAPVEDLAAIDNYFSTIAAMDVEDCGKLLVCQLETVPAEVRTLKKSTFKKHIFTVMLYKINQPPIDYSFCSFYFIKINC